MSKRLLPFLLLGIVLPSLAAKPEKTITSQIFPTDQVWSGDTVYNVIGNVLFPDSVDFTVTPGTEIHSSKNVELKIQGSFSAKGTQQDSIYFYGSSFSNSLFLDSGAQAPCTLSYCVFDSAEMGFSCRNREVHLAHLAIRNCRDGLSVVNDSLPVHCTSISIRGSGFTAMGAGSIRHSDFSDCGHINLRGPFMFANNVITAGTTYACLSVQSSSYEVDTIMNNDFVSDTNRGYHYVPSIKVEGRVNVLIEHNNFSSYNKHISVKRIDTGRVIITHNNFTIPREYSIELLDSMDLSAPDNHWQTTNADTIEKYLWHKPDNYKLGEILLTPMAADPFDSAGSERVAIRSLPPPRPIAIPRKTGFADLVVYDIHGRIIQTLSPGDNLHPSLPAGVYFLRQNGQLAGRGSFKRITLFK